MWITSLFKVTEKDKSEYALLCKLAYQVCPQLFTAPRPHLISKHQDGDGKNGKPICSYSLTRSLLLNEADSKSEPMLIDTRVNEPTGIFKINI